MVKRDSYFGTSMQESLLSRFKNWPESEIFAEASVPPETPFFIRLDGWRFGKLSQKLKTEKPFDKKFAKCFVSSGKILLKKGFNPSLIYVTSDEMNILFTGTAPFRGRIEKANSIFAGLVSSAHSLSLLKIFNKGEIVAFDSRIVISSNVEKIIEYLSWRQLNTWRNHNNASLTGFSAKKVTNQQK